MQSGRFGACLMAEPALVADCVRAMREAVGVPVTVKCRIGIDELDDYGFFEHFVLDRARGRRDVFIVHARKAYLQGLSPKENREIPPLRYEVPARLKQEHPELTVILNGGLKTGAQVREWLPRFDGVMLGRQAYQEPYLLAELDGEFLEPGIRAAGARGRRRALRGLRRRMLRAGPSAAAAAAPRARPLCGAAGRALLAALPERAGRPARRRRRRAAGVAAGVPRGRLAGRASRSPRSV